MRLLHDESSGKFNTMWRSHSGCVQFAEWFLCITSAEILMREAEEEIPTLVCDFFSVTQLVSERRG